MAQPPTTTSDPSDEGGPRANILPIPPAVEFPFPRSSAESSKPPSVAPHTSSKRDVGEIPEDNVPTEFKPLDRPPPASKPPRPRRFLSERPVPAQRGSLLRVRRGQTGHVPTVLNNAAGGYDTDTSSSSDDESALKLASKTSNLSGQPPNAPASKASAPKNKHKQNSDPQFSKFAVGNDDYRTKGKVSKRDGRLNIRVNETNNRGYLAHALGATLQHQLKKQDSRAGEEAEEQPLSPLHKEDSSRRPDLVARLSAISAQPSLEVSSRPKLNIVIMVIGSRGDIQPFLKIGKLLKEDHGHRVRIATHPAFKKFVEKDSGLEFFSVGGDPAELMAFMVKNPGLMPSISTVKAGEVGRRRDAMFEMFQGFWRACINATDDEKDISNLKMMGDKHPFVADAIIANPPCFAHVHCAERLGVPLHLMFTFPYSPTQAFPHPLANVKSTNVDTNYTNFMTYPLVEMMTWQGLGDLVNRFRVKTLGLEPVSTLWAPGQLFRLKVPYTYMWSPGLIPKPADWGPEIDIAGFVFLDLASSFKPPETLTKFLEAGDPPIYIGFGSIVVDDPEKFTTLIFQAVKEAGVRALVSKGWGGLGDEGDTPENIYMLENTPHDWLFPRVSAVVHHGGAGTTAIGLKCGKPTMIVPFFGDQPFWGAMVSKAGAGAREAIPYKRLTVDALVEGIRQCLSPEAKAAAEKIAEDIAAEGDGAKNAVESFHSHLPMRGEHSMRCSVLPDHVAVWTLKGSNLRLCALAAELLVEHKKIRWQDLRLVRHYDWNDFEGPGEPLTGGGAALMNTAGGIAKGVGGMPVRWARSIKKREKNVQKQKRRSSQVKRTSMQTEGTPEANDAANDDNDNEKTIHSAGEGQRGIEKHLPELHTVPHQAETDVEKQISPVGGPNHHTKGTETENDDGDSLSNASPASSDNLAQDLAEDTGAGFAKAGEALAKAPMDLSLAIAQGFHNAPRLYGDSTVRTAPRINGIQSGLRAAGSEFAFGVYDGFTGLVLQPYHGARDNGAVGLVKGLGKGFGGFVLKDLAAIIGPFGYTLKGVHKELIKGRQPTAFIRKARMIQGGKDVRALDGMAKERESIKIEAAWKIIAEIRKEDEAQKEESLKGRIAVLKEQRQSERDGAYESMGQAKKALRTKQEERKERQSVAVARNSKEERRGSRMFGKRKQGITKHDGNGNANGAVKGADRDVQSQVLDLGKGRGEDTTHSGHLEEPENGLANGRMSMTA
ncbi:hypothetical protein ACLMJK_000634 [Lecanora helva]